MVEELKHPDWLPKDWKVHVKFRTSTYGRKDKIYINTSNGRKFKSKLEVLRYLGISSPKKCDVIVKDEFDKVDIKRCPAENLPPGWIKEIRTKKKGYRTRRDPYYIDPVSGHHFRSMQEVYRYLQTKEDSGTKSATIDKVITPKDNLVKQSKEQHDDDDDSLANELNDKLRLVNIVESSIDENGTNGYNANKTFKKECLNKRKELSSEEEREPCKRATKRLARVEELVDPSSKKKKVKKTVSIGELIYRTSCNNKKEDEEENGELQLDSILMKDPCIEFAIKTLTGAIPIEEIKKACFW